MKKSPCIDCEERRMSCHSVCDKYKQWKKDFEDEKMKVAANKRGQIEGRDYARDACQRMKKSKRKY